MAIKPYRGRSRDRLTAIINAQNPDPRVEGVDFTYGPVQIWSGPLNSNTRVVLTPIPQEVYIGTVPITYKRLPISAILQLPPEERRTLVITELPFTTHSILDEINDAYGLDLEESEVQEMVYQEDVSTVTLLINPGNYAWLPSQAELPARFIHDINAVINNPFLGFENPPLMDVVNIIPDTITSFNNQDPITIVGSVPGTTLPGFENADVVDITFEIANPVTSFNNPDFVPTMGFATLLNGFVENNDLFIATELDGFTYSP